jgi:molybdenum-dependent DNA-binding transcriptional regulator ModE
VPQKSRKRASYPQATSQSAFDDVRVRYFLAVCECGSFTLASRACGVSQPCVTTAVHRLESAVGGKLFERRRPVKLTNLGTQLRPLLEAVQSAAERIDAFVGQQSGKAIGAFRKAPQTGADRLAGLGDFLKAPSCHTSALPASAEKAADLISSSPVATENTDGLTARLRALASNC